MSVTETVNKGCSILVQYNTPSNTMSLRRQNTTPCGEEQCLAPNLSLQKVLQVGANAKAQLPNFANVKPVQSAVGAVYVDHPTARKPRAVARVGGANRTSFHHLDDVNFQILKESCKSLYEFLSGDERTIGVSYGGMRNPIMYDHAKRNYTDYDLSFIQSPIDVTLVFQNATLPHPEKDFKERLPIKQILAMVQPTGSWKETKFEFDQMVQWNFDNETNILYHALNMTRSYAYLGVISLVGIYVHMVVNTTIPTQMKVMCQASDEESIYPTIPKPIADGMLPKTKDEVSIEKIEISALFLQGLKDVIRGK